MAYNVKTSKNGEEGKCSGGWSHSSRLLLSQQLVAGRREWSGCWWWKGGCLFTMEWLSVGKNAAQLLWWGSWSKARNWGILQEVPCNWPTVTRGVILCEWGRSTYNRNPFFYIIYTLIYLFIYLGSFSCEAQLKKLTFVCSHILNKVIILNKHMLIFKFVYERSLLKLLLN